MELIVLNIGLQAGVLHERTFAALVIMCILTTLTAFPAAQWIFPVDQQLDEDGQKILRSIREWEIGIEMRTLPSRDTDRGGSTGKEA